MSWWHYLVGPWPYGSFIIGYGIFVTAIGLSLAYWVRRRHYAWWRQVRGKSLSELYELKSCNGISHYRENAIDWMVHFLQEHPFEPVPEEPPAQIFDWYMPPHCNTGDDPNSRSPRREDARRSRAG
jgi:hypothetical protein